jgi:anti-sigma B factor antagonist
MRIPEFDIDIHDDGELLVVAPTGELDLETVPRVRESLLACTDGHRAAVLDLRQVTFMDSTAVRLLIEARNGSFGERFAIVGPLDEVGQVLDISGVRAMFRWVEEPRAALDGEGEADSRS